MCWYLSVTLLHLHFYPTVFHFTPSPSLGVDTYIRYNRGIPFCPQLSFKNSKMHLLPSLALLTYTLLGLITTAQGQDFNRTFTLTAYNTTNPNINQKPLLITPTSGIASVTINLPDSTTDKAPLTAFIWKRNIYRYCSTSPTGACIGMLTKAYGGALTGWYFHFSDSEEPVTLGPFPPLTGLFGLANDVEYPSPTSTWPCKPKKPTRVKVLAHSVGESSPDGIHFWTACDFGEAGQGYEVCRPQ